MRTVPGAELEEVRGCDPEVKTVNKLGLLRVLVGKTITLEIQRGGLLLHPAIELLVRVFGAEKLLRFPRLFEVPLLTDLLMCRYRLPDPRSNQLFVELNL